MSSNALTGLLDDACGETAPGAEAVHARVLCGVATFALTPCAVLVLLALPALFAAARAASRQASELDRQARARTKTIVVLAQVGEHFVGVCCYVVCHSSRCGACV